MIENKQGSFAEPCWMAWRQHWRRRLSAILAIPVAVIGSAACAQTLFDRDANVGVLDRPHPDYQALGLQAGSWVFYPKITFDAVYDDNIYATPSKATGDVFANIDPELTIQSNWNRNSLALTAGSTISRYAAHSDEDAVQYSVAGAGRLDIDHSFTIDATAKYSLNTIPRTSSYYTNGVIDIANDTVRPLQYDEGSIKIDAVKVFNRLKITGTVTDTQDNYYNAVLVGGGLLNERFLNNNQVSGLIRLDYAVSPNFTIFMDETVTTYKYTNDPLRNSTGTATLGGVNFQLTHLITGEIGVGYITSNYSDPAAKNFGGPDGSVKIKWYPTQLITVTVAASEGFFDDGILNSPAELTRTATLEADYELLRNLIIIGTVGGNWDDYRGIDRNDDIYNAGISANYLLNRNIGIALKFNHLSQYSIGADRGPAFNDDRFGLALTLQR